MIAYEARQVDVERGILFSGVDLEKMKASAAEYETTMPGTRFEIVVASGDDRGQVVYRTGDPDRASAPYRVAGHRYEILAAFDDLAFLAHRDRADPRHTRLNDTTRGMDPVLAALSRASMVTALNTAITERAPGALTDEEAHRGLLLTEWIGLDFTEVHPAQRLTDPNAFDTALVPMFAEAVLQVLQKPGPDQDYQAWVTRRVNQLEALAAIENSASLEDTQLLEAVAAARLAVNTALLSGDPIDLPLSAIAAAAAALECVDRRVLAGIGYRTHESYLDAVPTHTGAGILDRLTATGTGAWIAESWPAVLVELGDLGARVAFADPGQAMGLAVAGAAQITMVLTEAFDSWSDPRVIRTETAVNLMRADPHHYPSASLAVDVADPVKYAHRVISTATTPRWLVERPTTAIEVARWQTEARAWTDTICEALESLPEATGHTLATTAAAAKASAQLWRHCTDLIEVGARTGELTDSLIALTATTADRAPRVLADLASITETVFDIDCATQAVEVIAAGRPAAAGQAHFDGDRAVLARTLEGAGWEVDPAASLGRLDQDLVVRAPDRSVLVISFDGIASRIHPLTDDRDTVAGVEGLGAVTDALTPARSSPAAPHHDPNPNPGGGALEGPTPSYAPAVGD